MNQYVLALDQGTTSSRAILFDHQGRAVQVAQQEFPQILPSPGHVEHDPEAIWNSQLTVAKQVLAEAQVDANQLAALGITNQRETTLLWEADSGRPVGNAIVWQSRISAEICDRMKADGLEPIFRDKTGLLLDPYFSGTKIKYLLDQRPELRSRAERGEIRFGTVDSYLIWRLTEGRTHVTDVTNASRTLMLNLETLDWDDELLKLLGVPRAMLPQIVSSSGLLGETSLLGRNVPISGCAGDQQAALFGQACFDPGMAKNTYGTGCFLLMNTGSEPLPSKSRMLTTVAWRIGDQTTYCLEGAIFVGGAVVQWLRDGLKLIESSPSIESLAAQAESSDGVYFVPAFVGLGAPHWDPYARGGIFGLTRGTTAAQLGLAALESIAYQVRDVAEAMQRDTGVALELLKVDGGASLNNRLLQFQADMLGCPVQRPVVAETTALGAAYLAGLAVGYWNDLQDVKQNWQLDREFQPQMPAEDRQSRYAKWHDAVQRVLGWAK